LFFSGAKGSAGICEREPPFWEGGEWMEGRLAKVSFKRQRLWLERAFESRVGSYG